MSDAHRHLQQTGMVQVISTLTAYHEPEGGRHDRNAIVYLVHTQVATLCQIV